MITCCRLLRRGEDGRAEAVLCSHVTSSSWGEGRATRSEAQGFSLLRCQELCSAGHPPVPAPRPCKAPQGTDRSFSHRPPASIGLFDLGALTTAKIFLISREHFPSSLNTASPVLRKTEPVWSHQVTRGLLREGCTPAGVAAPAGSGGGWRSPPREARGSLSPTHTAASTLPAGDTSASCPCLQTPPYPAPAGQAGFPEQPRQVLVSSQAHVPALTYFPSNRDFAACNFTL